MNECLAKGPSLLNNLVGVLLRWRKGRIGFAGDISKMFHSIDITIDDQMTHLFLWQEEDETEPEVLAITTVNMGDRPSATIAQAALRKTAERESTKYPEESIIVRDTTYMDDIVGSVDTQEDRERITENIDAMVGTAGFQIKDWTYSYQQSDIKDLQDKSALEKVLGLQWNPVLDVCVFSNIPQISEGKSTKRIILSTCKRTSSNLTIAFTVFLNTFTWHLTLSSHIFWKKK